MILRDLIYVLQAENYEPTRFLKYCYTHLNWWKLMQRQKINWTMKARLIFFMSTVVFLAVAVAAGWNFNLARLIIAVVMELILMPLIVVVAWAAIWPIDFCAKRRIIERAKKKLLAKKIVVIGVTGSYGKTSTKEILAAMLSMKYKVLKTRENVNTDIGVASFILKNLNDEEIFIVEMGAFRRGDIKKLCELVKPEYSILTGINEAHLERFGSLENTIAAKFELPEATEKVAILNFADKNIRGNYQRFKIKQPVGVDLNGVEDIKDKEDFQGISFRYRGVEFETRLLARHNINLILLSYRLAEILGVGEITIQQAVKNLRHVAHRLEPIYNAEMKILIIDDSYNANRDGVKSGLEVLGRARGRKIVLTPGPLVELGDKAREIHEEIAGWYAKTADVVLLIKSQETRLVEGAFKKMNFQNFKMYASTEAAHNDLKNILRPGDTLLLQNDYTDVYF